MHGIESHDCLSCKLENWQRISHSAHLDKALLCEKIRIIKERIELREREEPDERQVKLL